MPPRMNELTEAQVNRIRELVDREYLSEGDLRREVNQNIRRLMDIGSYRGSETSPQPARVRPANPNQCPNAQGPAPHRCRPRPTHGRQEVGGVIDAKTQDQTPGAALRAAGPGLYIFDFQ